MPWNDVSVMDQKREFINLYISGAYSLSELCREFNISRPTARKYANRFKELGDLVLTRYPERRTTSRLKRTPKSSERFANTGGTSPITGLKRFFEY